MPVPRVFVSSTYYDLRYVRSMLEDFIRSYGFEPVLFERGSIAYESDVPLDQAGYREVESCQILVLIVGGRYGTPPSPSAEGEGKPHSSMTREEYRTAIELEIPTYTFVEHAVYGEYQTYIRNRHLSGVQFAHVESAGVFEFVDYVLNLRRNNFLFPFREAAEIVEVLRQQWAGLFYEYLRRTKDRTRMKAIETTVTDLREAVSRLEAYAERIVRDVGGDDGAESLIQEQHRATQRSRLHRIFEDFESSSMGVFISRFSNFRDAETWARLVVDSASFEDFLRRCGVPRSDSEYVASHDEAMEIFTRWQEEVVALADR